MVLLKRKGKVYCFCRKPDDGQFMLQCDQCKEWYHGRCINMTQEQADKLTRYFCATCKRRRNAQEKATQLTTCTNNTVNNNNNNVPQSPAYINNNNNTNINCTSTTTTTTSTTPTSPPFSPSPLSTSNTPIPLYFTTPSQTGEEMPHQKRQRSDQEGATSPYPSSPLQSPHSPALSPLHPSLSSHSLSPHSLLPRVDDHRESFWETIRRARGQV